MTEDRCLLKTNGLNREKELEKNKPFFTVVVPTYNQAQYLPEALDSLLNQTFKDWEAVIVNDGSTDYTSRVMEEYAKRDQRFRIFHKENGGVASALNVGINNALGEWICWLSSDDLFEPDKLETHFDAINKYPEIKFFHSHWYLFLEENKQKIAPPLWLEIPPNEFQVTRFFWANYIHGNAVAIHRSVFDDVGLFNESLRQGQDFDMWLRISARYVSFYIDKRTCVTRIHKGQTTNSFVEGGILDSTRALIDFLNSVSFVELFPFTDFSIPQNIIKAINEVIYISTKADAFLYRCGYTTALAEKTMEWLTSVVPNNLAQKLFTVIDKIVHRYLEKPLPNEVKDVLKVFLKHKNVVYKKRNFILETEQYVNKLILQGDQKRAKALETYLAKIQNSICRSDNEELTNKPILLGYPNNNLYETIDPTNIKHWMLEPGGMSAISIKHYLKVLCKNCNNIFNIFFEYEMTKEPSTQEFICPHCKTGYQFTDNNFDEDFLKFHHNKIEFTENNSSDSSKVAFFVQDASVVGGGTKVLFKYIDWLIKLGVNVIIYSFTRRPDWVDSELKYVQIQNELEIKTGYKLFFVFSIFDVTFILNRIPISKVVHICQGYEGYHFGRNYEELRSDKHILTKLHAIPVKNIVVSNHLVNLFREKFERKTYYIPNGIDHNIFSFNSYNAREKSILFVGNPFHLLKGFDFLGSAIKKIQNSPLKIDDLKLYIVMGFKPEYSENILSHVSKELDCAVEMKYKISSEEMSSIMQKVSMVACTSWYEGFSMPLLEAMATGTPVITTYNLGAQSFCKENYNSFNVEYGDLKKLTQIMIDLLYSSVELNSLIKNAYDTSLKYSEYNSAKYFINQFEKLFNKEFNEENKVSLLNEYRYKNLSLDELEADITEEEIKVSIVIPVFNQLDYTKKCIESLASTLDQRVELIIIDNGSTDETNEYLKAFANKKIQLIVIRNEKNLGFPKAVNQGIESSTGKYILIANNDIIFNVGWLETMLKAAENFDNIGLVGPISNEVSGLQKDNQATYNSIEEMHKYAEKVREKNSGQLQIFPRIAFLCTLIKREVIDKIGGLDERFSPGNYEDDDFCLRAQLAGFKTVIAKDVFIHHFGSKSFKANGNADYQKRLDINRQKFIDKWGGSPEEIWLQNKPVNPRQYYYPINKDPFVKSFERTKIHVADNEINLAEESVYEAVKNYNSHSEIISYSDLLNLAGNISLANNNVEKAAEYFESELTVNPNSSSACLGLGQVLFIKEQFEASKVMFEWAIRYDKENKHAIKFLAEVNEKLGYSVNHMSEVE